MGDHHPPFLATLALLALLLLGAAGHAGAQSTQTCTPTTCESIQPTIAVTGYAPVQSNPEPPVFGGYIYVANTGSNTVSVIQGTTNIANVTVGPSPIEPTFDPGNGFLYVPDSGGDTVSVLSGAGLEGTVQVGNSPATPAYDPANGDVYVPITGGCTVSFQSGACGHTIAVLSGTTVVANITVGAGPEQPAVDTETSSAYYGDVYVPTAETTNGNEVITVISSDNSIISTINLGLGVSAGAFFNPQNGEIYSGISVIKGTTVVGQQGSQTGAECNADCILDPYSGAIYVPGDGYPPMITGSSSIDINCVACAGDPTFDPVNGWVYFGGYAITGDSAFAVLGGDTQFGPDGYSPISQAVYSDCGGCYYFNHAGSETHGNVALVWGNSCTTASYPYYYNETLQSLCNGAMPPVQSNQTVPVYNTSGLPEAIGNHVFSVQLDTVNLVSGSWNATSSAGALTHLTPAKVSFTVTGPSGTTGWATITIPKVLVALYLFAQLQGENAAPASALQVAPTVFIDGQPLQASYFTSDENNFYITFQVHFSTHQITIEFVSAAAGTSSATSESTGGQSSSSGTASSTTTSSSTVFSAAYLLVLGTAMVPVVIAVGASRARGRPRVS